MSPLGHRFWPRWYWLLGLLNPLIGPFWRRYGVGNMVRVVVRGRRTGQPRAVFLGLLRVGDRQYLGHPDLHCAWTRNLEAAGGGELHHHDGRRFAFFAMPLDHGEERDAVIQATFHQHPFPGGPMYWLFRRHVRAVGRFYRLAGLEPLD